jgi:hypothetical protein
MPISTSDIQRMLNLIAQCIDELDVRLTNGQAFMAAEECPSEGSNQL